MNTAWHARHALPKNPTLAVRVEWHREHQIHCGCRPIPPTVLEAMNPPAAPSVAPARRPPR